MHTKKIAEKFPSLYRTWDKDSTIYNIVRSFGTQLDEAEKDVDGILRSKWVDTAKGKDLEMLGKIYNMQRRANESDKDYRNRLKTAIQGFKGGGTINAVLTALIIVLNVGLTEIKIIENPSKRLRESISVKPMQVWEMCSKSIKDAENVEVIIEIEEGEYIQNPCIINMDNNEEIKFNGKISYGEKLIIRDNSVTLNGKDITDKISGKKFPTIYRKKMKWRYMESLKTKIGVFDTSRFDESIFPIGISKVAIKFEWLSYQPATFEIYVPKNIMAEKGISENNVTDIINSVKSAGVNAIVKFV
ncbi:MAG: hypothetical protein CVT89_00030 [Candidatus Altiarchaeales archaeon HGW-Altiarchaeales-2]|nr:MAG: hypothetical protein CVT89_00030 [Candidatus Altiarchaeales archaeon HGW-Altiarchaeales-2]